MLRKMWEAFWNDEPEAWGGLKPIWMRWFIRVVVVSVIVAMVYKAISGTL